MIITLGRAAFRRLAILAALAVSMALGTAGGASALVSVDVTRGTVEPMPIAIPTFVGSGREGQIAADISAVVTADLQRSGLFKPLPPSTFSQPSVGPDEVPRFADWRVISAQALVAGGVFREADGRLRVEFQLWDVFAGQQLTGKRFSATADGWRRVAHIVADAIYERLTGEQGYFDTRIVYVDESGPRDRRVKRLAIIDQDGANKRFLTAGQELVITPRFSPAAQEISYVSYAGATPRVHRLNIVTGQSEVIDEFPGMTFAPRYAPNGRSLIMSLEDGGDTNIFSFDLATRRFTRMTDTAASDTAPSYAPDGSQIVFESDRGGSQQVYVMNADGSNPHRITFGNGTFGTPVWSPRGDLVAFTRKLGDKFAIGVMKPDGSDMRILTEGFHNEGPTWAPNGRVLMFFRESPGANGGPELWTIDITGYNEYRVPIDGFGSDPTWSPPQS